MARVLDWRSPWWWALRATCASLAAMGASRAFLSAMALIMVCLTLGQACGLEPEERRSVTPAPGLTAALGPALATGRAVAFRRFGSEARVVLPGFEATVTAEATKVFQSGGEVVASLRTVDILRGERSLLRQGELAIEDGAATVDRGPTVERLAPLLEGLAQSFSFDKAPPGAGDLVVAIDLDGPEFIAASPQGLYFSEGSTRLHYGAATWIDAEGIETPVRARAVEGGLELIVPDAVLSSSVFPALLDPIITFDVAVESPLLGFAKSEQHGPRIASNGTDFLTVWVDARYSRRVFGTRVTATGTVLDPAGLDLLPAGDDGGPLPGVASDGVDYLVAMTANTDIRFQRVTSAGVALDGPNGVDIGTTKFFAERASVAYSNGVYCVVWEGQAGVEARLIDTNGTPLSPVLTIETSAGDRPQVAGDTNGFLIVWQDSGIEAKRVTTSGVIVDVSSIPVGPYGGTRASVAFDGTNYLVTWDRGDLYGARVSLSGVVLDNPPVSLVANRTPRDLAFDGTNYVLSYNEPPGQNYVRVTPSLTVLDNPSVVLDTTGGRSAVACAGGNCFSAWRRAVEDVSEIYGRTLAGPTPTGPISKISGAANEQESPQSVFAHGVHLVVWEDRRDEEYYGIYATRVSPTGAVLDTSAIAISHEIDRNALDPHVTASSSGFLVTWRTDFGPAQHRCARLDPNGNLLDATPIVLASAFSSRAPRPASDGTDYLVVWQSSNTVLAAARISASGAVLDTPPIAMSPSSNGDYDVTGGPVYAVVANESVFRIQSDGAVLDPNPGIGLTNFWRRPGITFDGTNFVVVANRYDSGIGATRLFANRIAPAGTVLDGTGIELNVTPVTSSRELEVNFDGDDTMVSFRSNGTTYDATWFSPNGATWPQVPLFPQVAVNHIALSPTGDGSHSLAVRAAYDATPGVKATRVTATLLQLNPLGGACNVDDDCKTASCVDGVCCESACGGGSTSDCQSCLSAETGMADGLCAPTMSGSPCRAATGACDVEETCDGSSTACPFDAVASTGTVCRTGIDACDATETCNGVSKACPSDNLQPSGAVCRPAADGCDAAETCDGVTAACPSDQPSPANTMCRPSSGGCDAAEVCDGVSFGCPPDVVAATGTVCRSSVGACDPAELCDGVTSSCPPNQFEPAGFVCRPSAGPCDATETCTGGSAFCPSDLKETLATICRPATGACDAPELCDGASDACPPDVVAASTVVCRAAAGSCDVAEQCDGVTTACPADQLAVAGAVGEPACAPYVCGGTGVSCATSCVMPADCAAGFTCSSGQCVGLIGLGEPCTMAAACESGFCVDGVCCNAACGDGAQDCQACSAALTGGTDGECTALPPSTVCRESKGLCDRGESCDGLSALCPVDDVVPEGVACRASTGDCDLEEQCDGASPFCPADALADINTVCRPSVGDCDADETCDGASVDCPADAPMPNGAECDDGDPCTSADECQAGQCIPGEDVCGGGGGSSSAPPDEGDDEGGDDASGCACRLGAQPSPRGGWLWLGALALTVVRRRNPP